MSTTKRYQAVYGNGRAIVTVGAKNEREARRRIRKQLNRAGRRHFYQKWREDGSRVVQLD
jgi:hypothetical protein